MRCYTAKLTAQERSLIADCLEPQTFADGEVVIAQGGPGDKFFLIEKVCSVSLASPPARCERGCVSVQGAAVALQRSKSDEEVEVGRMHEGQYFGERALLTNEPRAATVRAVGTLKVAAMARDAFERLLGELKDVMHRQLSSYVTADDIVARRNSSADLPAQQDNQ